MERVAVPQSSPVYLWSDQGSFQEKLGKRLNKDRQWQVCYLSIRSTVNVRPLIIKA